MPLITLLLLCFTLANAASVENYGAIPNDGIDDSAAIQEAVNLNEHIYFPPGTYDTTNEITITDSIGKKIVSDGAVISYQSLSGNGFVVSNSENIIFDGLSFEGNKEESNINKNIGVGIYFRNTKNARVLSSASKWGGGLFRQDAQNNDRGLLVRDCVVYGFRGPQTLGPESEVTGCRFEQPETENFDRFGVNGSSSGIYIYAGRHGIKIHGNTFVNVRKSSIKVSGSALPIHSIVISNNQFINCGGGVEFGADDVQLHASGLIVDNQFIDCGSIRPGWGEGHSIRVFGSDSVTISGNQFHYTRPAGFNLPGTRSIIAGRYRDGSPIQSLTIKNNQFYGSGGIYPASIITNVIYVQNVSAADISNNIIYGVGGVGVHVDSSSGVSLSENTLNNVVTGIVLSSNSTTLVEKNKIIRGKFTSSNPQIRLFNNTGVLLQDNVEFLENSIVDPTISGN